MCKLTCTFSVNWHFVLMYINSVVVTYSLCSHVNLINNLEWHCCGMNPNGTSLYKVHSVYIQFQCYNIIVFHHQVAARVKPWPLYALLAMAGVHKSKESMPIKYMCN